MGVFLFFFFGVVFPLDPPEPVLTIDVTINGIPMEDMLFDAEGHFVGIPFLLHFKDGPSVIFWLPPLPEGYPGLRGVLGYPGSTVPLNWYKISGYYNACVGCLLAVFCSKG